MMPEGNPRRLQVQFLSNMDLRRLQADVNRILAMGPADDVQSVSLVVADIGGRANYTAVIAVRTEVPITEA